MTCNSLNKRCGVNGSNYKRNKHFYSSIIKYEWNNFEHEIVKDNMSKQEAENLEIELISLYETQNPMYGYNKASGGMVNSGFHLSEETKRKLSIINKGILSPKFGKPLSEETKQRMSEAQKGKPRKNFGVNNGNYGKKVSPEIKYKLRMRMLGRKLSEETKQKISQTLLLNPPNKGKIFSKEHKDKMSLSKIGSNNVKSKQVYCVELNRLFGSTREAEREISIPHEYISKNCRGKSKYAGTDTIGNKLHWEYVGTSE